MSRNRASKKFLGCVAIVIGIPALLLLYAVVWPPYYRQETIRVRIVDSETKKPIPGLAVVAQWWTSSVPFGVESVMRTAEATTNAEGVFELRGWTKVRPFLRYLRDEDPKITMYKYGYESATISNRPAYVDVVDLGDGWQPVHPLKDDEMAEKYPGWRWHGIKRFFYWNRKTIALKPTKNGEEAALALEGAQFDDWNHEAPHYRNVWNDGLRRLPLGELTTLHADLYDKRLAMERNR